MPKKVNWQEKDPFYKREQKKYGGQPLPSREYIMEWIEKNGGTVSFEKLVKAFGLEGERIDFMEYRIKAMISSNQLQTTKRGKIEIFDESQLVEGKIFAHPEGYGFFVYGGETDGFIPPKFMQNFMHDDKVLARVAYERKDGKKDFQPVKIIEHGQHRVVGKVQIENNSTHFICDSKRVTEPMLVSNQGQFKIKNNDIAIAEIVEYPQNNKPAKVKIIEILGKENAAGMETRIAIETYELPYIFSDAAKKAANQIKTSVSEAEANDAHRVDMRHLPFVTIDGIDSRDFDDAVYAERRKDNYALFVAIADVAHYVEKDGALDKEAQLRGTSVYFPDEVIPMLPERLSNGICSLNPDVDRLTLVCEMTIDRDGVVKRSKFHEAVIRSHARFTYETVEEVLFNENPSLKKPAPKILNSLKRLKLVYESLLKARQNRHAIDFEVPEAVFEYDSEKKIESISAKKRLISHRLIEECMVIANVTAAKFITKHKIPALYRVHDAPNEERLNKLITFVKNMGIFWDVKQGDISPKLFTDLLEKLSGKSSESLIKMRMLRSMMQAIYTNENRGHFGLSLVNYAHFTSPIRRYPDLLVHRAIRYILRKSEQPEQPYFYTEAQIDELGAHCSMTERRADDATRDAMAYLKCEFMSHHLGETFTGRISTVKNFGIFVDLDQYFIDGMVHISSLTNDYYHYNAEHDQLVGERTGQSFALLDKVRVTVASVNIEDKKIDFVLSDMKAAKKGKNKKKPAKEKVATGKTSNKKTARKKPKKEGSKKQTRKVKKKEKS